MSVEVFEDREEVWLLEDVELRELDVDVALDFVVLELLVVICWLDEVVDDVVLEPLSVEVSLSSTHTI